MVDMDKTNDINEQIHQETICDMMNYDLLLRYTK